MSQSKCIICNKNFTLAELENETNLVLYKGKKAHRKCFDHIMKGYSKIEHNITLQKEQEKKQAKKEVESKVKPVEVENEGLSEEEYQYKRKYYAYLREQLGEVTSKHYVMTDRYYKKFDYTFSGMYNTLVYMHEVLDVVFNDEEGNIVGLIPYHYEEAETYYEDLEKCENANRDKDISKMYQTRTIKITKDTKKKRGKALDF